MERINNKQLREIINLMRYAPTGDNSQHWSFKINSDATVEIHHDNTLSKHILNQDHYSSLLSLGGLIEIATIAATSSNHSVEALLSLENLDNSLYATLEFSQKSIIEEVHPLIMTIKKRETNRKKYQSSSLPQGMIEEVKTQFKELGINIRSTSTIDRGLLKYLIKCDSYIWNNRTVFTDTAKWIRFSYNEKTKTKDGFSLENLNLKNIDGIFIKLLIKSKLVYKIMWPLALKWKSNIDSRSILKNTSNLICFTTKNNDAESIVNIGRAMYITWLRLNKSGNGVQPLTVASLLPFIKQQRGVVTNAPKNYLSEFDRAQEHFSRNFNLDKNESIVWMLRTGKAFPLVQSARTVRRDIESFLVS